MEPIVAGVAREEHADYTLMDSFLNVAFGTVLGGGLHALGGAVRDAAVARPADAPPAPRPPESPRPESPAPAAAEPLATMRALDLDPVTRPADIGPRDPDVDQAALRAALSDLADRGSVRNADVAVRGEIERLAQAYGEVRARPMGNAMDPAVTVAPGDIASAIIARGGWNGLGDVSIQDAGWGLVKFIWKHGEEGGKPIPNQVTEQNVIDFPRIVREFAPSREPKVDPNTGQWLDWEYRVSDADGRTIVYAVRRFDNPELPFADNQARVVTMHVEPRSPDKTGKKLSAPRPDLPPRFSGHGGDTAAPRLTPEVQGRATAPAPGNLGAPAAERNPATIRADAVVKESLPTGQAERLAAADEALAQAEADLARALDAAPPEVREAAKAELEAIKTVAEEGDALSNATRAAAQCLRGN